MRVISQNGTIDVPYERYTIWCYKDQYLDIYHIACDCGDEAYRRIAEYSDEEKAVKAIGMLKEHYGLLSFMKLIAGTTKYESFIKRFTEDEFIKATTEYFRFPQDDEIEV